MAGQMQLIPALFCLMCAYFLAVCGTPIDSATSSGEQVGGTFLRAVSRNNTRQWPRIEFTKKRFCGQVDDAFETSLRFTNCNEPCRYRVKSFTDSLCSVDGSALEGFKVNQRQSICAFKLRYRYRSDLNVSFSGAVNGTRSFALKHNKCTNLCNDNAGQTFYPDSMTVANGRQTGDFVTLYSAVGCDDGSKIAELSGGHGHQQVWNYSDLAGLTRTSLAVRSFKVELA